MDASLGFWLAIALGLFWTVGVYNRLMRLRARSVDALRSVEKHVRQYTELVHGHLLASGLNPLLPGRLPAQWEQLLQTLKAIDPYWKEPKRTQFSGTSFGQLVASYEVAQTKWKLLRSKPADSIDPPVSEEMAAQWDQIAQKVQIARGGLNQILTKYNAAIAEFPALIVAKLFGFSSADLM